MEKKLVKCSNQSCSEFRTLHLGTKHVTAAKFIKIIEHWDDINCWILYQDSAKFSFCLWLVVRATESWALWLFVSDQNAPWELWFWLLSFQIYVLCPQACAFDSYHRKRYFLTPLLIFCTDDSTRRVLIVVQQSVPWHCLCWKWTGKHLCLKSLTS